MHSILGIFKDTCEYDDATNAGWSSQGSSSSCLQTAYQPSMTLPTGWSMNTRQAESVISAVASYADRNISDVLCARS